MNVKVSPARHAAFEVLSRVEREAAFAGNLLASSRYARLPREDHALFQELVLGVLRRQGQLDFLIEHYSGRRLDQLDFEVVLALRLGLYQLGFLSRIPSHAAINESVNLVKEQRKKSAAPLVNAVLRAAQRAPVTDFSDLIDDPWRKISVETSHPEWLIRRWVARLGEPQARDLAKADNRTPPAAFRFNPLKASEDRTRSWFSANGINFSPSAIAPGAGVISEGHLSPHSEPVREGWIYLQDEASQLVAQMAAVDKHEGRAIRLLDLCAAPGGKTTLLASLLPKGSRIVAGDMHQHRLRTMKSLCEKLGTGGIDLVRFDANSTLPFPPTPVFDLVLLDAPCSGLGTLSRHPEIKWRMTAGQIADLATLQLNLVENGSRMVAPGGVLTYAVCSTEPEEGEEIIARFRRAHPEYRDITRERLTELGIDPEDLLTQTFGARTFPHLHGTDGFFICVLWKRRR